MPLFFILSGFFFLNSLQKRGFDDLMKNKIETIVYPFIIWSLLQTSIEVITSKYTNGQIKPDALLTCLIEPRSQFWFLFALFFIILIAAISYLYIKLLGLIILCLFSLSFILLEWEAGVFTKTFIHIFYFLLGTFFSLYYSRLQFLIKENIAILINLLVFILSEYLLFNYPSFKSNLIIPQITGSLLIIQLSYLISFKSKNIFQYLGENSMPIYLASIIGGSGTRILLLKVFHIENLIIHLALGTILGIVFSLVLFDISKRTKYLRWLFFFPSYRKVVRLNLQEKL